MSVGEQLKRARTDRRLSMKDVTQATKIQSWTLEALEQDQLHTTMSPVYVKGFLLTYARFLGLAPAPLIAQLLPPPPPPSDEAREEGTPRELAWTPVWESAWPILRRLGAVAVGVAAVGLLIRTRPFTRIALHTTPHQQASVTLAHQPPSPTPSLESSVLLEPTQPLTLTIVTSRPTWVSIKADGALLTHQQLTSGTQKTWKARRQLDVVVGTPTKIDIFLNGQSIKPMAVAHHGRLVITHDGVKPIDETSP